MQNGVSLNVDANANGDMMSMSPQRANQNQMKLNATNIIRRGMPGGMMNPQMQGIPAGNRMFMQPNMLAAQAQIAAQTQNAQLPSQSQQQSASIPAQANPSLKRNNEGVNQPLSSPTKRQRITPNDSANYIQNVQAQRSNAVNQQAQMPITQQSNMILTTPVANANISSPELKSNNNNNRQTPNLNGKKNAPTPQMQMRQPVNLNNKPISPHGNLQSLSVQNSHDIQDPQLMNQVNLPNTNIHNNTLNAIPIQNAMSQAIRPPNLTGTNIMQNYGMGGMVSYPNRLLMQQALMRPNAPDAQKINPGGFLNMDQSTIDKFNKQQQNRNENKVVKNQKPTPSQTQPQQPSGGSSIAVTNPQQMVGSNGQAQSQQPAQTSAPGIMPSIVSQQDSSLNMNMEELESFASSMNFPMEDLTSLDILGNSAGANDSSIDLGDFINFDIFEDPGSANNAGP
ncbi:1841_t:CDS:2, partial [Dentiscutata heterogama]